MNEKDNISTAGIHSVYIAIGSNISPEINIRNAIKNLSLLFSSIRHSSAWISPPINGIGPKYFNVVAEVFSSLTIDELKNDVFSPIENAMGRIRTEDKDAPRTIDIDIIIYSNQILDSEIESQPHITVPLAEINPLYKINQIQSIDDIAKIFIADGRITPRKDILDNNLSSN